MPSRPSAGAWLALVSCGLALGRAWAMSGAALGPVLIDDAALLVGLAEVYGGEEVSFVVAEGLDARGVVDCLTLPEGADWSFEVSDDNGDGALATTALPGFRVASAGASLSVTGGALVGWCGDDSDEDGDLDLYAHALADHTEAKISLVGVTLGADVTGLSADAHKAGLYGAAGALSVEDQVVTSLPFTAVKLLGAKFTQTGGRYVDGETTAILSISGELFLTEVTFTGGRADRGAHVLAEGGSLTVSGGVFERGVATQKGGAIAAQDAVVTLTDVEVQSNSAAQGGGLWVQGGSFTATGGALSGNVADEHGGGLYGQGAALSLSGVLISSNLASVDGGGVYSGGEEGALTLDGGAALIGNEAVEHGGGVFVDSGALEVRDVRFTGNGAAEGGAIGARDAAWVEVTNVELVGDTASLKGGGLYLQRVVEARLCGLLLDGVTAALSGGGVYALDTALTLGDGGDCAASEITGAAAPEGAALSLVDTSAAPDGVGLSVVGLTLTQLNPGESGGEALFASTAGAVSLRSLSAPSGLGDLALLTAVEAAVTLHDLNLVNLGVTDSAQFAATQQSLIQLTRPASVDLQRVAVCGVVGSGAEALIDVEAPVGDVLIERSALYGLTGFAALVRVLPDDTGASAAAVTLRHNSLLGASKGSMDGAELRAERVTATGNLLHRLDAGLILSSSSAETYNLFGDTVSEPRRDEDGAAVRIDETSTDEVEALGLVTTFSEGSCAAPPELLEGSPAVNGGDPAGERDPDGSIADQGALPTTLSDSDGDGSYDVDDCAPLDPTIGDTVAELYGDGLDNDCDPSTRDDDEDGDGLLRDVDCDDTDPSPCPPTWVYAGGRAGWGCAAVPDAAPPVGILALTLLIRRRRHGRGA
ncbi:hypothetical protein L6R49_22755 [Myxococcota bacterium]|nr:hypothetical protein [Myxococcota bacterium]